MNPAELYSQIKARGGWIALPRAKFKLTGADRVRYLNGQVSNDVKKLGADAALPACVMTAKGKMSADVFISAAEDFLLVDAELELRESLQARLERYIISDDVTLEDVTDDLVFVHFIGPANPRFLGDFLGTTPRKSRRYGHDGWDLFYKKEEYETEHQSVPVMFRKNFLTITAEIAETLRIEAGIPSWGAELDENILPAEAGLDRTAVDFHKGCYIGQEVVSRIKSVGHVNKELRGFISTDGTPLAAGMKLYAPADPAKEAGWLTSAAHSFALEKPAALGYLKRGIAPGVLHARAEDRPAENIPVEVKELPLIP